MQGSNGSTSHVEVATAVSSRCTLACDVSRLTRGFQLSYKTKLQSSTLQRSNEQAAGLDQTVVQSGTLAALCGLCKKR
mgnify:CR=1 FL=1